MMEFDSYYVVLLQKGPTWTPESTPALEADQERHLAHLAHLHETGQLAINGPVEDHADTGVRGISVYHPTRVGSLADLRALVEKDPHFLTGRLTATYLTWYVARDAMLKRAGSTASEP